MAKINFLKRVHNTPKMKRIHAKRKKLIEDGKKLTREYKKTFTIESKRLSKDSKKTCKERKNLRASDFALPEQRKYPIYDIAHARNALSRVSANGTLVEKKEVRRAVHKRFKSI